MRILIVDDDGVVAQALAEQLTDAGYETLRLADANAALDALEAANPQPKPHEPAQTANPSQDPIGIVLIDLNLPGLGGMEMLRRIGKRLPAVRCIVVTGFGKIESAVKAMQLGAVDYLTKPVANEDLRKAVTAAANQHALISETPAAKASPNNRHGITSLVGTDFRMQKVYDLIESVAPSRTTVLITGSSGTGKTMAARAIHNLSPRAPHPDPGPPSASQTNGKRASAKPNAKHRNPHGNGKSCSSSSSSTSNRAGGPFVTFSCGSIPEPLAESELFGHVRGAFTGADYDKPGKILSADGGTLFIDEINSASAALQMKLLRVLQERTFEPVGSIETKTVDVRFVLAANADLGALVSEGTFREDLYYRINVVNIHMPALSERPGDIAVLAEHFLDRHCAELQRTRRLGSSVESALQTYPWPGNVRELENAIERAVVLSHHPVIELEDLPESVAGAVDSRYAEHLPPAQRGALLSNHPNGVNGQMRSGPPGPVGPAAASITIPALTDGWTPTHLDRAMEPCERQILIAALEANAWNRQATSSQLGINRTTLYKKIKHHHLDEP